MNLISFLKKRFVNDKKSDTNHCVNIFYIWSYSGPYFPAFRLNTDRYEVSLRIQSEWGQIWTRITLNTDTFHAVNDSCTNQLISITHNVLSLFDANPSGEVVEFRSELFLVTKLQIGSLWGKVYHRGYQEY